MERCIRYAFDIAAKRNQKKKLTLVDKTNVLTYAATCGSGRSTRSARRIIPDIKRDYALVDATCMWFVKNPEWFDVIVTNNMFGDIITDLGAMIQGGMGIAAGGNINPEGRFDVRADRRFSTEIHGEKRDQPVCRYWRPANAFR